MSSSNDNKEKLQENITDNKIKKDVNTKKKKKNLKKRCNLEGCRKKLKLTDLECVCKKRFCSHHRIKTCHNCSTLKDNINVEEFQKQHGLGGGQIEKLNKI